MARTAILLLCCLLTIGVDARLSHAHKRKVARAAKSKAPFVAAPPSTALSALSAADKQTLKGRVQASLANLNRQMASLALKTQRLKSLQVDQAWSQTAPVNIFDPRFPNNQGRATRFPGATLFPLSLDHQQETGNETDAAKHGGYLDVSSMPGSLVSAPSYTPRSYATGYGRPSVLIQPFSVPAVSTSAASQPKAGWNYSPEVPVSPYQAQQPIFSQASNGVVMTNPFAIGPSQPNYTTAVTSFNNAAFLNGHFNPYLTPQLAGQVVLVGGKPMLAVHSQAGSYAQALPIAAMNPMTQGTGMVASVQRYLNSGFGPYTQPGYPIPSNSNSSSPQTDYLSPSIYGFPVPTTGVLSMIPPPKGIDDKGKKKGAATKK